MVRPDDLCEGGEEQRRGAAELGGIVGPLRGAAKDISCCGEGEMEEWGDGGCTYSQDVVILRGEQQQAQLVLKLNAFLRNDILWI